jgi:hypothetical protein
MYFYVLPSPEKKIDNTNSVTKVVFLRSSDTTQR